MTDAHSRFPLAWPAHRPRRKPAERRRGEFKAADKAITLSAAVDRLETEIDRLGATNAILSSNVEPRLDGRPRSGITPADPGVCLYFTLKGQPVAMPCDTFTEVQQNVAALAAHIDAIRRQERYGVATTADSLQAFLALPAPSTMTLGRDWRTVLGLEGIAISRALINAKYQLLATDAHPDKATGSEAKMAELNVARDQALASLPG